MRNIVHANAFRESCGEPDELSPWVLTTGRQGPVRVWPAPSPLGFQRSHPRGTHPYGDASLCLISEPVFGTATSERALVKQLPANSCRFR
jgi:hypothetical protein